MTGRDTRSSSQSSSMLSEIKLLIEENRNEVIQTLKGEINSLKTFIATLTKRVDELEKANSALSEKYDDLIENMSDKILDECDQRKRRERNVVISGLDETVHGTVSERIEQDKDRVAEVFKELALPDMDIESVQRLGKPASSNGKRLLLVKLQTFDQKMRVLQQATALRNSSRFRRVYINPDLTPLQQSKRRELMAEIRRRRDNNEDVIIFRNRVVLRNSISHFHNRF